MKGSLVRKLWGGMSALAILGFGFLFFGEPLLESREAAAIEKYIESLPGDFKAESVSANLLEGTFSINNLTGTLKNADGSESGISVSAIEGKGLGRGAPGAPLLKEGQITHLNISTAAFIDGAQHSHEVIVESLRFHDLEGTASTQGGLPDLLANLSVGDLNVFAYSDTAATADGKVTVKAQSLNFKAGPEGRGAITDLEELMLPAILEASAFSDPDRLTIQRAWTDFTASGGILNLPLRSDQPLSMQTLDQGTDLHVAASLVPAR